MNDKEWQLVPRELTPEMKQAFRAGYGWEQAWRDALAAAPQPPEPGRLSGEREALDNCRLFAAKHRKEEWAQTILRFCTEGGCTGSPLRAAAGSVGEK